MKTSANRARFALLSTFILSLFTYSSPLLASDPIPAPKQKKPIAIIGATIHTLSGADVQGGTIVFDKGKIVSVGVGVPIPADAEKVDATGKHVYPGLIDASTTLGLYEIGSVRGTLDMAETGPLNPNARAEVAVNPESELIPVARSNGIAIAASSPEGGLISGTIAAIMTDGWTGDEMTLRAPLGLVVNWPQMSYVPNSFSRQTKEEWLKQRDDQLKSLRKAFADARAYATAKKAENQKGIPYHDTDSRWEAMIPVLEGKIPVFVHADDLSQIQAAITWSEEEQVKIVLVGGHDAWRVAEQLVAKHTPVIVNEIQSAPLQAWEPYDLVFSLPKRLKDAGVAFCISGSSDPSFSRNVPYQAATAAAYGLSKEDAIKSITLYAAQVLGIADRVGSLEVGKDATLFISTGDPLEPSSTVEQLYIEGKKVDMRDKHKQLYEKYREKYKQVGGQ